ncbi:peptide ABC transporter ATP-binding protein [Paenibacillus sp. FSL H7-0326]|nr:peptide ABC transporter ATP-binding protein [Paenibacillus sp. FSL H7-0326]
MLCVNDLSVAYKGMPVLKHAVFSMKEKEIVCIVGESGSGKSTLIRTILGLLPAGGRYISGDIVFQGNHLLHYTQEEWRRVRGKRMAMIFQDSGSYLNPIRKVGSQYIESIRTHFKLSKKTAYNRAVQLLSNMKLDDPDRVMNAYPCQLSGGMRQRVSIAMAMAMEPELLLADEPTSALDVITQAQVMKQLLQLRDTFGTGIIMVTHNMAVAAHMADKIGVMKDGKIVEWGNAESMIDSPKHNYTMKLLTDVPELEGKDIVRSAHP